MIRTALAVAVLFSAPALSQEAQRVVLKERLTTAGASITLGDLFEINGASAETALARAPEPGGLLSLDPTYVQRIAAREGLSWANAGGLLRVTVERSSRSVTANELASVFEEMLFVETGQPHAISITNSRANLAAPIDTRGSVEVISFDHDARSGLFRAQVRAWADGPVELISGRAEAVIDLPVLTRPIARGEIITAGDIAWTRLPSSQARQALVMSEADLVGMAARRSLRADLPVREFDVEAPSVIERGEIVSLIFQSGTLTLAARARAMESAAEGDLIRFVNLQSNRTVEAIAEAPGRARVLGPNYTH